VLGGRPWDPAPVIDADPTARQLGVRRGIPLGSAHRLVPEATFIDPDPEADRGAAEAVFEALGTFSPSLAGTADSGEPAFGLFEVGIDGLGPLWGPEPVLVERLAGAVAGSLPGEVRPRVGVAGTHFAATVAAMAATPDMPILVPPGDETAFLADRPSALLTTDPDVRARLTRFGLRRIGAVADLPRSALIARFGEEGGRLHARANGQETKPFRGRRATQRLGLALPIDPPVEDLEPLRFVLHRLVAALTGQLTGRGLAAERAILTLELDLAFAPTGTPLRLEVEQRFPEPTADPEAVERLLFARLEREPPAAAVARLDLELRGTIPAAGQQRCSCPRPRGRRGSAGSSPGWR
jgi:protein ImuB